MIRSILAMLTGVLLALVLGPVGSLATTIPRSVLASSILSSTADLKKEYDYVIVGGGTAGLTVADRLTENGRYTVLVIEHGTFDNGTSVTTVAMGYQGLLNASHLTTFPSEPQTNLGGRTANIIVGKLLGGSSGVNGMQFHRGQKEDYNRWGAYFGRNSEWNWEGLLPYFKKAFHFHPPNSDTAEALDIKYDQKHWGKSSNIHASFPSFNWPMLRTEAAAFRDIPGVAYPSDSGAGLPGVFWYPATVEPKNATRSFARTGHWDWIRRWNYETITGSKVLKVLFKGNVADGVLFVPSGSTNLTNASTVRARKEVIIAAGTIHTPQILQASGVGPKSLLSAAGIPIVVDLPGVGQNFQDHPLPSSINFSFDNFTVDLDPSDLQGNATFIAQAQAEFAANRSGPYTIASGNCGAFLSLPVIAPSKFDAIARRYTAQLPAAYLPSGSHATVIAGYAAQKSALAKAMRSRGTAFYNLFLRGASSEGAIVLLHPLSRGTVNIRPTDPFFAEPAVDYRALSNPADIEVLTEFVRFTRRYFSVPSLARFNPREVLPGANITDDADIHEAIKAALSPTTFHPIGTASMLPLELGGVVSEKLLVYGTRKLSVIDASIIPDLPGAYTQQSVYAIAEKAADIIKSR